MKKFTGIFAFLLVISVASAQSDLSKSNKEKAYDKGMKAIEIMDQGQIEESIKLLKEAEKLDPERMDYPYEIAYANYMKKDYKETIKILEKLAGHDQVSERLYQLLGNSYDMIGKPEKAFEKYDEGLRKFPHSGMLYLEKGNMHWGTKEYEKALVFYEKGIEEDPSFPSNYYRAARIYCNSDQAVWGMLYGEIFMNLERGTKRTEEISKLLFDTYKSQIKVTSETSMSVDFCKNVINVKDGDAKNFKMPFCLVYEPTLLLACTSLKAVDMTSLDKVRTSFVETYYQMGHEKTHPNILFEYQHKLIEAGHMEAYNHWILLKGDEDGFTAWQNANKDKWDNFVSWFKANPLQVDASNRFYSGQY